MKLSESERQEAEAVSTRFIGDPAFKVSATLTEEQRLSATVSAIVRDTYVVPRGSVYMDTYFNINLNDRFSGLSRDEQKSLGSFLFLRSGYDINARSFLEREKLEESIDVLEPVSEKAFKGQWTIKSDDAKSRVYLHNEEWPGSVAYLSSQQYGNVYYGTGQKAADVGYSY